MGTRLEQILNEFQTVFSGQPWYGKSIQESLQLINLDNINNVAPNQHRVGQILDHMLAWRVFAIEQLQGNKAYKIEINSDKDWTPNRKYDHADLQFLKQSFIQTQQKILTLLEGIDDKKLDEKVPGQSYSFAKLLTGIIQHDIYHLGQINICR